MPRTEAQRQNDVYESGQMNFNLMGNKLDNVATNHKNCIANKVGVAFNLLVQ